MLTFRARSVLKRGCRYLRVITRVAIHSFFTLMIAASISAGQQPEPAGPLTARDLSNLSLEELSNIKVTSASLHEQTLQDAPASVTVITAEEIRKFGYRTLAEALSWVRGFYTSSDYTYTSIGVRGFSLPGYETRYLVMINGHSIADNVIGSVFVGSDFPLEMDLVDRIEVVRGPSSALYGSSAVLASINVITRKPSEAQGAAVRVETGSLGERDLEVNAGVPIGKAANLLVSASAYNDVGARQLYFSGYDTPENNFGRAIGMDGQKGYRAFANLTWGNWNFLGVAGDRVKTQPFSWADTIFNDRGTRVEDSRGFFEVSYNKDFSDGRILTWRASYDAYRFRGIYHYATDAGVEDYREHDYGDWLSSRLTYRFRDWNHGYLTVGSDVSADLRALQTAFNVAPQKIPWFSIDTPDVCSSVFAQQEIELNQHWQLNLGARFDYSLLKRNDISPRLAVVYSPSSKTSLKMTYGRGFRNPSTYDMFYNDGFMQIGNADLRSETTDSYEVDIERRFGRRLRASASVYHYNIDDSIEQIYVSSNLVQFQNADYVHASGVDFELEGFLPGRLHFLSSLELQRAVSGSGAALINSPGQIGKFRLSVPFARDRFTLGIGLQALGERRTYANATVPWVILPDVVVSTRRFTGGFQLTAGVKNFSNSYYRDPAGMTPTVDSVVATGRTFFVNVSWASQTKENVPSRSAAVQRHDPAFAAQ